MPPSVAFLCPMALELAPLARRLGLARAEMSGLKFYRGERSGRQVVAVVSGIGTQAAASATEELIGRLGPGRVVVVGIAGATDDHLAVGSLVRPEVVIDASSGARLHPDHAGGPAPSGGLLTSDALVGDPGRLAQLAREGVVCVDMETAAVGLICQQHHTPWSVFRAISDRAGDGVDTEVLGLSRPDGRPDLAAAARYLARHPARLARLSRLARGARLAAEVAAEAAALAEPYL